MTMMSSPPSTLDIRITMADGRVVGLTYMHDGFAPTMPCTHRDDAMGSCYMPANALIYELGTQGRLYRFCGEHMPTSVLEYVKIVLQGMRGLSDREDG